MLDNAYNPLTASHAILLFKFKHYTKIFKNHLFFLNFSACRYVIFAGRLIAI